MYLFVCFFSVLKIVYSWLFNVVKTQKDIELIAESLKALNSWMKMICIFDWPEHFQFVDVLTSHCVSSIASEEGHLSDLTLEILSGIIGDPTAHQHPTSILKMLDKIIPLQGSLDTILQRQDMVRIIQDLFISIECIFMECFFWFN